MIAPPVQTDSLKVVTEEVPPLKAAIERIIEQETKDTEEK